MQLANTFFAILRSENCDLHSGNACYLDAVQSVLSFRLLLKNTKLEVHRTKIIPVFCMNANLMSHVEARTQTECV